MTAHRVHLLVLLIVAAAAVISGRLIQIQSLDAEFLAGTALRQRMLTQTVPARPGDIIDRHGRLLATTIESQSLYAVPNRIQDPAEFARLLATCLDIDVEGVAAGLIKARSRSFLWVRRRLSPGEAEATRRLPLPDGTWGFRPEYRRCYPQGHLAAHVLGIRDVDGMGRGGIEELCDSILRGDSGTRVFLRDARGRILAVRDELGRPPRAGRTIVLTLDAAIQHFAEAALDDLMAEHGCAGACAIVMVPASGELLAMASRPDYDPNRPETAMGDAWADRAVTSVHEPGSTFKPLVLAWAADLGAIERDETIDCEGGAYRSGARILHDHHAFHALSVTDVLVNSSNIGMAKIGERIGAERLFQCVEAFGFGRRTGIGLPGEEAGTVRPLRFWNAWSVGSVPMGHEIAVTPLQLITAHAALANGGVLLAPRIVLREIDASLGEDSGDSGAPASGPPITSRVIERESAEWIVRGPMVEVVRRGTGKAARIPGHTVFGKTGTAQKFDADTGEFSHDRHVVSFLAGAPADDPRVLVLVMADEPRGELQGGGAVAGPAAADLLHRALRHLGVSPDGTDELDPRDELAEAGR